MEKHRYSVSLAENSHLIDAIRRDLPKTVVPVDTPFGRRRTVHCDHLHNGRNLEFVESFISQEVLPNLAQGDSAALQTRLYLDEVLHIVHAATHSVPETEAVYLVDNKINNDLSLNGIELIHELLLRLDLKGLKPLIITSKQTNLDDAIRIWRSEILVVQETDDGRIDLNHLKQLLRENLGRMDCRMLGIFPVCSDQSGTFNEDLRLTALLHYYGALAIFDYSVLANCAIIDANPLVDVSNAQNNLFAKDGLVLSLNSCMGGRHTKAALVIRRKLIKKHDQSNASNLEMADILARIRAGLALQLKLSVGPTFMMRRMAHLAWEMNAVTKDKNDVIVFLGNRKLAHTSSFAFLIRQRDSSLFLHHKYVCALFRDLFGIAALAVAGLDHSYSRYLLGIDEKRRRKLQFASENDKIMVPGFVQIDLPWFFSNELTHFILAALLMVAEDGWRLLPQYNFSMATGEWVYGNADSFSNADNGDLERDAAEFKDVLDGAQAIFQASERMAGSRPLDTELFSEEQQSLRWFLLPSESHLMLTDPKSRMIIADSPKPRPRLDPKQYEMHDDLSLSDFRMNSFGKWSRSINNNDKGEKRRSNKVVGFNMVPDYYDESIEEDNEEVNDANEGNNEASGEQGHVRRWIASFRHSWRSSREDDNDGDNDNNNKENDDEGGDRYDETNNDDKRECEERRHTLIDRPSTSTAPISIGKNEEMVDKEERAEKEETNESTKKTTVITTKSAQKSNDNIESRKEENSGGLRKWFSSVSFRSKKKNLDNQEKNVDNQEKNLDNQEKNVDNEDNSKNEENFIMALTPIEEETSRTKITPLPLENIKKDNTTTNNSALSRDESEHQSSEVDVTHDGDQAQVEMEETNAVEKAKNNVIEENNDTPTNNSKTTTTTITTTSSTNRNGSGSNNKSFITSLFNWRRDRPVVEQKIDDSTFYFALSNDNNDNDNVNNVDNVNDVDNVNKEKYDDDSSSSEDESVRPSDATLKSITAKTIYESSKSNDEEKEKKGGENEKKNDEEDKEKLNEDNEMGAFNTNDKRKEDFANNDEAENCKDNAVESDDSNETKSNVPNTKDLLKGEDDDKDEKEQNEDNKDENEKERRNKAANNNESSTSTEVDPGANVKVGLIKMLFGRKKRQEKAPITSANNVDKNDKNKNDNEGDNDADENKDDNNQDKEDKEEREQNSEEDDSND